jgi:hypothetical protein
MKSDAQLEVRELAEKMLQLVNDIPTSPFKHTIEAFGLSERLKEAFHPPY